MTRAHPAVIPAQAGIQWLFWTPAYAGVTKRRRGDEGAGATGSAWECGCGVGCRVFLPSHRRERLVV